MIKYAYKTEITKFGELKIHFPTLDFTKVTKFDAAKQSARDLAKASLHSYLQLYINQRREIPATDDYPFVAERIELDWQTDIRVRLSNWFLKNTTHGSIGHIDQSHSDQCGIAWAVGGTWGAPNICDIPKLFNLNAELNITDLVILAHDFSIDLDFKEVKLELKDKP